MAKAAGVLNIISGATHLLGAIFILIFGDVAGKLNFGQLL